MDNSLQALCDAVKKILSKLKPQNNQLSFVVMIGKDAQGKSALLKQSAMEEMPVFSEQQVKIYFNQQGIVIELSEAWFINSNRLLHHTVKQLNRCNSYLKITGIILCIDVNELLCADRMQFTEQKRSHLHLLERWGINLGYPLELAVIITKMDTLAGFTEFYQSDHDAELAKPLGFSLDCINNKNKKIEVFSQQFNQLIETLGQQVIAKMHPARSTIRRSLIREFPLQVASLRAPIYSLLQGISPKLFRLHSIYFTSAEQGGVSIDRLNKKIQHEYALMVQDTFPQATNFRAFFVEGALKKFQEQCSQIPQKGKLSQKPIISIAASIAGIALCILSYHHYKTVHHLDEAIKELLAYDLLNNQENKKKQALYHLSNAAKSISDISTNALSLPTVHQLKSNLQSNAKERIKNEFVPSLLAELEEAMTNPQNAPLVRYKALKAYLMFGDPKHFSSLYLQDWFNGQWKKLPKPVLVKQLTLLKQSVNKASKELLIKDQIIRDVRNYLNALPTNYFYYSLIKDSFPKTLEKISVEGFMLSTQDVPVYFTKSGFNEVMQQLPDISLMLKKDNWVLANQSLEDLQPLLIEAYCNDYVSWWQNFMRKSRPAHFQEYSEGRHITQNLVHSHAIEHLTHLIQEETKADLTKNDSTFNQLIASKFTELNLMSASSIKELNLKLSELEHFISTLSMINDNGRTAFNITKSRFNSDVGSDPVNLLYNQAGQLPEPLSIWAKQLATETWSLLIKDSRLYINQEWQQTVYREFQNSIAKRYPFDASQEHEISIADFNHFFGPNGSLNQFINQFIKPFMDVSKAEWKPKVVNDSIVPITLESLDNLMRANIITAMFFPDSSNESKINFSLQKISLDPVVSSFILQIGQTKLKDTQNSDSLIYFKWPQANVKLTLNSIEGNHYELAEEGDWALFKLLEKVNVLVDEQDNSSLQILFEVNSNSGRYLLKTNNPVNPFTPGILNGFGLNEAIV